MGLIDAFKNYKKLSYDIDEINIEEAIELITKKFKESKKNEIIIVNIGTDKSIGDSYGPFCGSFLKEKLYSFPVYGTLENPIHALNLESKLGQIKDKHNNAFIIALDACATKKKNSLNKILIENKPIQPGEGVDKELTRVGDLSIKYVCCVYNSFTIDNLQNFNLGTIYKAVRNTYTILNKLEDSIIRTKEVKS